MNQDSNKSSVLPIMDALSPLDGRYRPKLAELKDLVSDQALTRYRFRVEILWLDTLLGLSEVQNRIGISKTDTDKFKSIISSLYFDPNYPEYAKVKEIEQVTNHDVKAVEIYTQNLLRSRGIPTKVLAYVHFGCTSEDINNISYSMMVKDSVKVLKDSLDNIISTLDILIEEGSCVPMVARTHGQIATPTTVGKELSIFRYRLVSSIDYLSFDIDHLKAKLNGATGGFNALMVAYPDIDWMEVSRSFLLERFGLNQSKLTTQIESKDSLCAVLDSLKRINSILLDLTRDIWGYISLGYFGLKLKEGEVGSSTMPHKVNPIDFENAEGNLGIAISLIEYFTRKLPISRFQRDLSDSTVLRSLATLFSYTLLSYKSLIVGLKKLKLNEGSIRSEFDDHSWVLLGEAIQTVLRSYGDESAYNKLKELTRGKNIGKKQIQDFISSLSDILPSREIKKLQGLSPDTYTGLSEKLAKIRQ